MLRQKKLAIPEYIERQIEKCISYIVNTLRDPPAAEAVLGDIERAYDLLEKMASPSKHMNPCKS